MASPNFRIPPVPRGLPRHLRPWYVALAALITAVAATVPMCPQHDSAGRPLWRVAMVNDGDTVTCIDETGRTVKIRLLGIDAPEFDQPHGRTARNALDQKLASRRVRVAGTARDQHGRLLGTLWLEERDLNRELVAEGHAWVFGGFARVCGSHSSTVMCRAIFGASSTCCGIARGHRSRSSGWL